MGYFVIYGLVAILSLSLTVANELTLPKLEKVGARGLLALSLICIFWPVVIVLLFVSALSALVGIPVIGTYVLFKTIVRLLKTTATPTRR